MLEMLLSCFPNQEILVVFVKVGVGTGKGIVAFKAGNFETRLAEGSAVQPAMPPFVFVLVANVYIT